MTKSDLIAGKYWVKTKSGEIGCVMEKGIIFKYKSQHINNYDEFLVNSYNDRDTIIEILAPKEECSGNFIDIKDFRSIVKININPITSLNQLEKLRKELEKKYCINLYISNLNGKYEMNRILKSSESSKTSTLFDLEEKGYILQLEDNDE